MLSGIGHHFRSAVSGAAALVGYSVYSESRLWPSISSRVFGLLPSLPHCTTTQEFMSKNRKIYCYNSTVMLPYLSLHLTETSMASQCVSLAVCFQPIHCPAEQPLPSQPKYILLVSNYWPPNTKIQIHFDPTTHIAPKYTRPCLHPLTPQNPTKHYVTRITLPFKKSQVDLVCRTPWPSI